MFIKGLENTGGNGGIYDFEKLKYLDTTSSSSNTPIGKTNISKNFIDGLIVLLGKSSATKTYLVFIITNINPQTGRINCVDKTSTDYYVEYDDLYYTYMSTDGITYSDWKKLEHCQINAGDGSTQGDSPYIISRGISSTATYNLESNITFIGSSNSFYPAYLFSLKNNQ